MSLWTKFLAGGPGRATRLHDHHGKLVSFSRVMRNGPRATVSGLSRVLLGNLPRKPWISYDGQVLLEQHLSKNSRVLEFGSGSSTAWFADHSGFLLSHEHNSEWYEMIGNRVGDRADVVRKLCLTRAEYVNVESLYREKPFDLIMVDGRYRDECLCASFELISETGVIYLDNSDKLEGDETGDIPRARKKLHEYAEQHRKLLMTITDFAPSQMFVSEATIVFNGKPSK